MKKSPIDVSKKCYEGKHVDLLLKESKNYCVLIKDSNSWIDDHTLHRGRKQFCRYWLQAFITAEKLKCRILKCQIALKLMVNKLLGCLRRVNIFNSKVKED